VTERRAAEPSTDAGLLYLDTSAVVKLVRPEAHSAALTAWLRASLSGRVVSSVLLEVELPRAIRRSAPDRLDRVPAILAGFDLVTLSDDVVRTAAGFADPLLRSLDAVHLASAQLIAAATPGFQAFVAYDTRLLGAATARGLAVAAPGLG